MRDRPNPYSGVDPLLAFVFDEVEKAERIVAYRQEDLHDATERARRLREIFTLVEAQRRPSGATAALPPPPTRDRSVEVGTTEEVMIALEAGRASYPMPPHSSIGTVDLARRDPREHPDAASMPIISMPPEDLERHKKWIAEDDPAQVNRSATPSTCASDPAAGTVEFYPVPDRAYFVRVVYRPVREP